jgi:hypothetical protein
VITAWEVVHRTEDGERVGYLASAPGCEGLVVPMSLVGTPAGGPLPAAEATTLLVGTGLALLARRWWCRLPDVLPPGVTDAAMPDDDWPWRPAVLVEVSPREVRLRPELPAPEERTAQAVLPVPVGELLTAHPPW